MQNVTSSKRQIHEHTLSSSHIGALQSFLGSNISVEHRALFIIKLQLALLAFYGKRLSALLPTLSIAHSIRRKVVYLFCFHITIFKKRLNQ